MENFYTINLIDGSQMKLPYNEVTKRSLDEYAPKSGNHITFIDDAEYIMKQLFENVSDKKITFIDIGANCGLFSLYCSPICEKIFCIEPTAVLCRTIKEFSKDIPQITVSNSAISTQDGTINFYFFPEVTGQSTIHNRMPAGNSKINLKVQSSTLPNFLKKNNLDYVDIVKMDIEGEEVNIFTDQLIEELKDKVGRYWVECHHTNHINGMMMEQNYAIITQRFLSHGYKIHQDLDHFGFIAYR
jgi:FkbM family methyltransferase